ncbi:hypothetical protein T4E_7181 [Trichinella pseudospiralis]|uniref:Uncharacterized protein n=1 Tax=Trichinella pseudospiralis TaxID=6337 RepID=A0A0V0XNG7_TRIPS|nr:hypothetical protein T4E_7181 [Trichinella pseudospiralis]
MRHYAKFKLSPNLEVTEQNTWIYKNWWNKMHRNKNPLPSPEPEFEKETRNEEICRRYTVQHERTEERQFLTMDYDNGSDYDF